MARKMAAIILAAAMLVSMAPLTAFMADGQDGGSLSAAPVDTGVKLSWAPSDGAIGYRLFRYVGADSEGMQVDGLITATDYVDVDVDANTEYTYQIVPVMTEGEEVASGGRQGGAAVTTDSVILGGSASDLDEGVTKNVILMKIDDPNMSVNGTLQEIDPGRGTKPIIMNSRTLVPIRAIIEAMDGVVGWEDATQKITLSASGYNVEMWLDKTELLVDGVSKTMDVAPTAINDRTMVPVRFAAENVGCAVGWIEASSEIVVVYYKGGVPPAVVAEPPDTDTGSDPVAPVSATGDGPVIKSGYSAAELAKIAADFEALIQDEPSNGRAITFEELMDLQDSYYKPIGGGDTYFVKTMTGMLSKSNGKWLTSLDCEVTDYWSKDSGSRRDALQVKDEYSPEGVGKVKHTIDNDDASYYYTYSWNAGETEGRLSKYAKTSYTGDDPGGTYDWKIMRYEDAAVGGQDCIVYSFDSDGMITYYWFSKSKGFDILTESFFDSPDEVFADFTYDTSQTNKDDSYFDPDKQGVSVWAEVD